MATNTIKGIRKNAENANVTKFHCHAKQAKLDFNTRTHTHTQAIEMPSLDCVGI